MLGEPVDEKIVKIDKEMTELQRFQILISQTADRFPFNRVVALKQ